MKKIDLRSDTVTQPTDEMRRAMANAEVGDDVYQDDPTIIRLEQLAAEMTGKEAALYVASGTMGNQLAIMTHTRRGDEIILDEGAHVIQHEVGASAILSGVSMRPVPQVYGRMKEEDFLSRIRTEDIHNPPTTLLCLENAHSSGAVLPLSYMERMSALAHERGLKVHLDGARLFNAAAYLGVEGRDIAQYADSVDVCLSKGLCAPVGSVLCGTREFIARARKNRKILGGGMRQCGILGAAGIIALRDMTKRLPEDHENARYLAKKLSEIPGVEVNLPMVHINLVYFTNKTGVSDEALQGAFARSGIVTSLGYIGAWRFATHYGVTRADIDYVIDVFAKAVGA